MSIQIQLNSDLEQRLRQKASSKGIGVNQYISQFLEHIFPKNVSAQPTVSEREAILLQQINLDISTEKWEMYLKLKEKSQKGKLTKSVQEQYLRLIEDIEIANAKRIAVLAELAQLRNVPIRILMEQMGIAPHYE
jgi:hypothetical protein